MGKSREYFSRRSKVARDVSWTRFQSLHLAAKFLTGVARQAIAAIRFDQVDTSRVVGALVVDTVVDVGLAAVPFVSGRTVTAETAFLQHFASGAVAARIAVTGVDGRFAQAAVIAGRALTLVVTFTCRLTSGAVLARERVTRVALGQDFIGDFACQVNPSVSQRPNDSTG